MKKPTSQPSRVSAEILFPWVLLGAGAVIILPVWGAVAIGSRIAGVNTGKSLSPFAAFFGVLSGDYTWPLASAFLLALFGMLMLAVVVFIFLRVLRRNKNKSRVDPTSQHLGKGQDIEPLTEKHAMLVAKRLGVEGPPGLPLGTLLGTNQLLMTTWEDLRLHIWGPRVGKTTSQVVPGIMAAPGAVLSTSNKPDVFYATGVPRSTIGRCWVFDPQRIDPKNTPTMAPFWIDLLEYVVDDVKATELAGHFAAATRANDAKEDSYFDPKGKGLLADLFLASAVGNRPITDVYEWTTNPEDFTPVTILRANGWDANANAVTAVIGLNPKTRDGIYGTAEKMASPLKFRAIAAWISPVSQLDSRPKFNIRDFVRGKDTLYALSREGAGSASALTTALTAFVCDAAEQYALEQPSGRLRIPFYVSLDEAANVCKWAELPSLFSHYGSRGIILDVILQSWSQGVSVWGEQGMSKLWSASNVATYGGGVREPKFLSDLSTIIGDFFYEQQNVSSSKQGTSISTSIAKERILTSADLSALPKGRCVVLASGSRPTLIRTQPWMRQPYADTIRASIRTLDPQSEQTITDANEELAIVDQAMSALEATERSYA